MTPTPSRRAGHEGIVLNFTGLEYMNASGIGLLVTLLVRANRQQQQLLAYGLTDHYRQIFELTRLDEAIGIHDTEADALAAAADSEGTHMTEQPKHRDAANWAKPVDARGAERAPGAATSTSPAGGRPRPSRASARCGRRPTGSAWRRERDAGRGDRRGSRTSPSSGRRAAASTRRSPGSRPGEVALLNLTMPGGIKLSTGVLVLYADDESFTLMTPQGHMFAGLDHVQRLRRRRRDVAQAHVLMRASDPMYEMGLTFGGHGRRTASGSTRSALAAAFGVEGEVDTETCASTAAASGPRPGTCGKAGIRSGMYTHGAHGAVDQAVPACAEPGARRGRRRLGPERARRGDRAGPGRPLGARARGGGDDRRRRPHRGADAARLPARRLLGGPPAALGSPFLRALPLAEHGLELRRTPTLPLAHPLDDGTAVVLHRSVEETAAGLGEPTAAPTAADGPARATTGTALARDLLGPLRPPRHPLPAARFARARRCARRRGSPGARFGGTRARALLARERGATRCCRSSARPRPRSRSSARARPRRRAGRSRAAARRRSPTRWRRFCARSAARSRPAAGRLAGRACRGAGAVLFDVTPRQLLRDRRRPSAAGRYRRALAPLPLRAGRLQARLRARRRRCRGRPPSAGGPGRSTSAARWTRSRRPRRRSPAAASRPARSCCVAQQSLFDPTPRAGGHAHAVGLLPRAERLRRRHDRGDRAPDRALRARLPRRRRSRARDGPGGGRGRATPTTWAATSTAASADLRQLLARPVLRAGRRTRRPTRASSSARRPRRPAAASTACAAARRAGGAARRIALITTGARPRTGPGPMGFARLRPAAGASALHPASGRAP